MGIGRWEWAALAVAIFLGVSPSARAAGFVTQSFPVPVSVEKERVRSSMRLQLDVQRYGVPFDAFAAGQLDGSETAFRDFMTALRAGDVAKTAALRPGDAPDVVQKLVDNFHQGFAQPQVPRVVARIGVGDGQLFVWQWASPRGPVRRGFTVVRATPGVPRVEVVTSERPLETLIVDAMQQELLHPDQYAPGELRGRYKYTFPLAGAGKPGAHPVVLGFDGQAMDVEVMGKDRVQAASMTTGAAAASVFQSAYNGLAEGDVERWIGAYTDKSKDKLRAWAQGLKPAELSSFIATTVKPRRVRFLLDADPVQLLFYTVETSPKLEYEYLLKTPAGYKLTNAYFEGFLDDVLRDNALFPTDLESFRKSVLAASPR
jgi:hypothetical protein